MKKKVRRTAIRRRIKGAAEAALLPAIRTAAQTAGSAIPARAALEALEFKIIGSVYLFALVLGLSAGLCSFLHNFGEGLKDG